MAYEPQHMDRAPQVIGVHGLFITLTTLAIAARCYCRICVVKSFGWDDYFSVGAYLGFVFFVGFGVASAYHGSGVHATNLQPLDMVVGIKWWWVCEPVYVVANMCLKMSIGIFLLRIAVAKTHRIIIYTVIIVTEVYCVFFFFLFVFQCIPSDYFWTRYTGGTGHCIDSSITVLALYVYSGISCWADWTLGILPIFLVWNLQMNGRTKSIVALILAVGAIGSTATIIRIPFVQNLRNESDFLYAVTDVAIWSTSETGIGITASCVATLRPLFRTFFMHTESAESKGPYSSARSKWPSKNANAGYIRSKNQGAFNSEIALREDIGKGACVTTVVESDMDLEKGADKSSNSSWNAAFTPEDAEGSSWGSGIRKTVESSQQFERK